MNRGWSSIQLLGMNLDSVPQFIASDIALKFVNKIGVPATKITFLVNDGRYTQSVVDKGTFSSGVQIKHNFAVGSGTSALSDVACKVAQVDFADGSAWHIARGNIATR